MDNQPIYVSVSEFSRITGIPQTTIRDYCDKGIITCHRPGGWKRIIPLSEGLEQLKKDRTRPQKAPKAKLRYHHGSDLRVIPTYKRQDERRHNQ